MLGSYGTVGRRISPTLEWAPEELWPPGSENSKSYQVSVGNGPWVHCCPGAKTFTLRRGSHWASARAPPISPPSSSHAKRKRETVTVTKDEAPVWATHQRKVIGVDPYDAQVRVVCVVPGNLLQDLQELIAIWSRRQEGWVSSAHTWFLRGKAECRFSMRVS